MLPLSLIFVGMITFNNLCLQYVEVSFCEYAQLLFTILLCAYSHVTPTTMISTFSTLSSTGHSSCAILTFSLLSFGLYFHRQRRPVSVPRLQCHFHLLGAWQVHQPHHLLHVDRGDRRLHSWNQRRDRFFPGGHFRGYFVLGVRVVKQHFHLPDAPCSGQRQVNAIVLQQYECNDSVRAADLHVRVPGIILFLVSILKLIVCVTNSCTSYLLNNKLTPFYLSSYTPFTHRLSRMRVTSCFPRFSGSA